jgi:DNA-binding transcriptional LysR family regulator
VDIRLYKTFLAAASGLSLRKAAAALHLSPSTVTCHIRDLENHLGVPLFERAGRGVALTEHGRRLTGRARELVDLEERARGEARGEDGGACAHLRVRISESLGVYCLPEVLPAFRKRFPGARLTLATRSADSLERDLRGRTMDLALLLSEPFAAPGLRTRILAREELVCIAAPSLDLANGKAVRPADLAGQALIVTPHAWSARTRVDQALAETGVSPASLIECGSLEIVKRLVMAGQGVSIAPRFAVTRETSSGLLAALPWAEEPLSAPVLLLHDRDRPLTPAEEAFCEAVEEFFGRAGKDERNRERNLL